MYHTTSGFIQSGKINMIIDGSFGSTGKGLIAARISIDNTIHIAATRLSPNAGHTFYHHDKKHVVKLIPVSAIIQPRTTIYIGPGSIIDLDILFEEMDTYEIDDDRLVIHPRAAVITSTDKEQESSTLTHIASTLSGSGSARASKIMRTNPLAQGTVKLHKYIKDPDYIRYHLDQDLNILVETGQGYELSINTGYDYPHCTSIDITPSAILADVLAHPKDLGSIMMTIRTFPIRVGNIYDEQEELIGYSGPTYQDSDEITFKDLNIDEEYTTVTKRKRRIFTWSEQSYINAIDNIQPDKVFLNFVNYLREDDLKLLTNSLRYRPPDYIGIGPHVEQICHYDENCLDNYIQKFKS